MMNTPPYPLNEELLVRFLSGDANEGEKEQVNQWLEAREQNRQYFDELTQIWNASAAAGQFSPAWQKEDWSKVIQQLPKPQPSTSKPLGKQRSLAFQLARVAAVLALIAAVAFFLPSVTRQLFPKEIVISGNVQKIIALPDGSSVYLNKDARLYYADGLTGAQREVKLEGEAFFEVAENRDRPFVIRTGEVITQVVGTSFNVSSNTQNNKVIVTVVTGKVRMFTDASTSLTLTPGDRGTYHSSTLSEDVNGDVNFLSWKTNMLTFKDTPLRDVVDDLSRHYRTPISLDANALSGCTLTATFENQTLDDVVAELKILFSASVEQKNNVMVIAGKSCR